MTLPSTFLNPRPNKPLQKHWRNQLVEEDHRQAEPPGVVVVVEASYVVVGGLHGGSILVVACCTAGEDTPCQAVVHALDSG